MWPHCPPLSPLKAPPMPAPGIQRRWKNLPGEPVGDAGDPYTGYDRFGRTEQMRWIKPHLGGNGFDTLANVQWGYNRASQKTWRKDLLAPASTGQDQHFGYDGLNQVTERQRGLLNINTTAAGGIPAQVENFSYDETGNWITYKQKNEGALDIDQSRVNNQSNQMTQVDGSSAGISYDKNGNMLSVPTGEGLTGPSRKLVWDAWNRLTKVTDENDNVIAEYDYDGLSRRTKVTSGGVTKHSYYDDQWRTVEERLDSSTTPVTQHVWHPTDRWELLFRDRSTANDGTLDERLYSLKDQLDPVAICDASGSVVERFAYSAFGVPTLLNSSFIPQPSSLVDWSFLFHAEFADNETGWFNYGYRYYVPTLGRWLSRDPIGIAGGLNLYEYVRNGPTGTWDLVGLEDFTFHQAGSFAADASNMLGSTMPTEFSISAHINGLNNYEIIDERGKTKASLSPAEVAKILNEPASGYKPGTPIRLYVCHAGDSGAGEISHAEKLAELMKVRVSGPTGGVEPIVGVGIRNPLNKNQWLKKPKVTNQLLPGSAWKDFQPKAK
jgi:RHS repeat-associated protein